MEVLSVINFVKRFSWSEGVAGGEKLWSEWFFSRGSDPLSNVFSKSLWFNLLKILILWKY